MKKGKEPEVVKWYNKEYLINDNFLEDATLYFGIGIGELHREEPIRSNWAPYKVYMPLIENMIDVDEVLKKHKIRPGSMYDMNFSHNNCWGRCVKAGQGHFKNLMMKQPEIYNELMEQEIVISEYIRYKKQPSIRSGKGKDYLFDEVWNFVSTGEKTKKIQHIIETNKYTKNNLFGVDSKERDIKKQYTFMKTKSLEELYQEPVQCDIWDVGGCGCFIDYEDEREEKESKQQIS
ncbi:hypothetical protein QTG56_23530 (plasmid) [Rossellomorea sp. AcN35-11]|nr:hypothetical protein QTG56_23530 [Rossellomorea sp. AcN35-11]